MLPKKLHYALNNFREKVNQGNALLKLIGQASSSMQGELKRVSTGFKLLSFHNLQHAYFHIFDSFFQQKLNLIKNNE